MTTSPGHAADVLNREAVSSIEEGQADRAEALWRRALEADARHAEASYNLGLLRWRTGRIADDDLVIALRHVAAADAGVPDAVARDQLLLGLVHAERGDRGAALAALDTAAQLAPRTPDLERTIAAVTDGRLRAGVRLKPRQGDDFVWGFDVTPDGRSVLTGTEDGVLRLRRLGLGWDREVRAHTSTIRAVAVTPDGREVLSGAWDGTLQRRTVAGRRLVEDLRGHRAAVVALAVSADGRRAFSGSRDGDVRIWDLGAVPARCAVLPGDDDDGVCAMAITPDGRRALTGHESGWLVWWDVTTGRRLREWAAHGDSVFAVAVAPDGSVVVSAGDDGLLRWWEPDDATRRHEEQRHHQAVAALAVSPDGRLVASTSMDRTVRCWEIGTGRCVRTIDIGFLSPSIRFAPDGSALLVGGPSGLVVTWPLDAPLTAPWRVGALRSPDVVAADAARLADLLADADRYLAGGDAGTAIGVLDRARLVPGHGRDPGLREARRRAGRGMARTALLDARCEQVLHTAAGTFPVAVSPDGCHVLSRDEEGTPCWWDLRDGRTCHARGAHAGVVTAAVFTGTTQAVTGGADGTVRIWELATGTAHRVLLGHDAAVVALAADPPGRHVVSGDDEGTLRVWDPATGACRHVLTGHDRPVCTLAVTADGARALSGDEHCELRWWDLDSGACVAVIAPSTLHGRCHSEHAVAAATDGRRALVGVADHGALWLRLPDGVVVGDNALGPNTVTSAAMPSDGAHALSGADDTTVRCWDAATGTDVRVLDGHRAGVHTVAITPDGETGVSADRDGEIRIWAFDWVYENGR